MTKKPSTALMAVPADPLVRAKTVHDWALTLDGLSKDGKPNGQRPRHEEANMHYRVAAELGLRAAMFNLGINYLYGLGVHSGFTKNSESRRTAVYWFQEAARAGLPRAYTLLGHCQENGLGGFRRDPERAKGFYWTAAVKGDPQGEQNLARLTGKATLAPALMAIAAPA